MLWRIFYADGTTFSDSDGSAEDAPMDGVQVIMEYYADGTRTIHQGCDYYWQVGSSWASGNTRDLDLQLRLRPPVRLVVLFGRWMPLEAYKELVEQAMTEHCNGC